MKNHHLAALVSALALLCSTVVAQTPNLTFSGAVVGVSANSGTMILSNGPHMKMTLTGLHQAQIRAVDGRLVTLGGLRPGMPVSVTYLQQGREWVVSRVLVPAAAEPNVVPVITDRRYQSLFDGDVTTNPGAKRFIRLRSRVRARAALEDSSAGVPRVTVARRPRGRFAPPGAVWNGSRSPRCQGRPAPLAVPAGPPSSSVYPSSRRRSSTSGGGGCATESCTGSPKGGR